MVFRVYIGSRVFEALRGCQHLESLELWGLRVVEFKGFTDLGRFWFMFQGFWGTPNPKPQTLDPYINIYRHKYV